MQLASSVPPVPCRSHPTHSLKTRKTHWCEAWRPISRAQSRVEKGGEWRDKKKVHYTAIDLHLGLKFQLLPLTTPKRDVELKLSKLASGHVLILFRNSFFFFFFLTVGKHCFGKVEDELDTNIQAPKSHLESDLGSKKKIWPIDVFEYVP